MLWPKGGTEDETQPLDWKFEPVSDSLTQVSHKRVSILDLFRQWLEDGLTSCTDIANEIGVSKGTVSKLAMRGIQEGWVKQEGREYKLVP